MGAEVGQGARSLREPGAILLVSCYELGHQPLGVAWPLAFLERAGYAPAALDLSVEPLDPSRVARARLVGISVPMHTALRLGARAAERCRALNPSAHVCLYGLYALLNADHLLAHGADSAIGGECEGPLVALADALEAGLPGPVPGVRRRGQPAPPHLERLSFPVPSRAALPPLERYARLEVDGERRLVGCVEASRGCRHGCLHCPIPPIYGGRFFVVPREVVLEDCRQLVAAGAAHITFGDPDFLNGPGHALAVCRALQREFPGVTFDFTAKVEHLLARRDLLPEFAELGCAFVVSAVESLSDRVLRALEKGHARADVHAALTALRRAGIALRPTWVPFTPFSTLDDYLDILDFVEGEGLIDHVDPVQYSIRLLVPPGSALLARWEIGPHLRGLDEAAFFHRWEHPDPRMDRLQRGVAALVEEAARAGKDAGVTFHSVREMAQAAAGRRPAAAAAGAMPSPARHRPPRLTEPWFC